VAVTETESGRSLVGTIDPRRTGPALRTASARTVRVPIEQIKVTDTPREVREDPVHVRILAESMSELPPILVRSTDLSIVDGTHRLAALRKRGASTVEVVMFGGNDVEAYVEAVRQNVRHGKPLTIDERRNATKQILRWEPNRSDRSIAEICGVSAKTVATLRGRATATVQQLNTTRRVGRDGRVRPTDLTSARQNAAELLRENPSSSLREIARKVGTSVNTVRDVHQCLLIGRDPAKLGSACGPQQARTSEDAPSQWEYDQAFMSSSEGREFAEWFDTATIDRVAWQEFVESIPLSRIYEVIDEARRRAAEWDTFAKALSSRVQKG
jgi:ParB-like chromosome segregation protein Spo0J